MKTTDTNVPLVVDLDDTLIRSDVLWESVVQLWRMPALGFRALAALLVRGKAAFKAVLASRIKVDAATLPYRQEVLQFLTDQHRSGRQIVLATATHRIVAEDIARHVGLFSQVLATEGDTNLSAGRKRVALEKLFGARGFDYIGDHRKDLPVFAIARAALLVNPSRGLLQEASANGNVSQVFKDEKSHLRVLIKAMRLHQWAKNILLAVPIVTAHRILEADSWLHFAAAFVAFGLVASATYLVNDLLDLQADRLHARKKFRPLASGNLGIGAAVSMVIGLGAAGFALSVAALPRAFTGYLVAYLILTLAYSFYLKRRLLVDVMALAVLYTLRILAGAAATGIVVSEWLLIFSVFLFSSLAFLKRIVELQGTTSASAGRGYSGTDADTVRIVGVSLGLISVLVMALYITSPAVTQLYRDPKWLWGICLLLTYWIARIWFLAARGQVDHDPVVFALVDWRSYVVGVFGVAMVLLAKLGLTEF